MPPCCQFRGQLAAKRVILPTDTNPCGGAVADNQQTQGGATPHLSKPWSPRFRQAQGPAPYVDHLHDQQRQQYDPGDMVQADQLSAD